MKKPWLLLPSMWAYGLSRHALKAYGHIAKPQVFHWQPFSWRGLNFANRLGIAGGVDKNAELLSAFWALGAGFLEVGTVTPEPQDPNPGRIIDRDNHLEALWNKLGFPNGGIEVFLQNISQVKKPYSTPVFVNIGKNRHTLTSSASKDYVLCLNKLKNVADAFVINISSPNTAGLRELLTPQNLSYFLEPIIEANQNQKPLLLKLSPDMSEDDLKSLLDTTVALNLDGWILTNTTLARTAEMRFPAEGGVSGRPLAARSKSFLQTTLRHLGEARQNRLVVSVGGVMSPQDVKERIELGADLVQIYSALVFSGPFFFRQVAKMYEREAV